MNWNQVIVIHGWDTEWLRDNWDTIVKDALIKIIIGHHKFELVDPLDYEWDDSLADDFEEALADYQSKEEDGGVSIKATIDDDIWMEATDLDMLVTRSNSKLQKPILCFNGHPFYPIVGPMNNSRIARFIASKMMITHTMVNADSSVTAHKTHNAPPFHPLYISKNLGQLVLGTDLFRLLPEYKLVSTPIAKRKIIAVEGIIAAGKTTYLDRIAELKPTAQIIHEPTDLIYATIEACIEKGMTDNERQKEVEEVILKYELEALKNISREEGTTYIERNWLYCCWVFGVIDSPFPIIDPHLEPEFSRLESSHEAVFEGTIMVKTDPEEAYERSLKRGKSDGITLDSEIKLAAKLKVLSNSPYEWSYGHMLGEIKTNAPHS